MNNGSAGYDVSDVLGCDAPIVGAPMAGGPSTVDLTHSLTAAGGFGFLAGGYLRPEAFATLLNEASKQLGSSGFGVNLFVPDPGAEVSVNAVERYRELLMPWAQRYGIEVPAVGGFNDDSYADKVDLLCADPPQVVSFTFAPPSADVVHRLRHRGVMTMCTVTTPEEAVIASDIQVDALTVQSAGAGGHNGTFTPQRAQEDVALPDLIRRVRHVTKLPIVGAGGVGTAMDVRAALDAGASAVAVGTLLIPTEESGAKLIHKQAVAHSASATTVVTRAFSGRPARALVNDFTRALTDQAPQAYPYVHYLTAPIRAAYTAHGDPSAVNLWAGRGHSHAVATRAGNVVKDLLARI